LFEHDPFRKPASTFRDHALKWIEGDAPRLICLKAEQDPVASPTFGAK
jgi:hypothetical protein